MNAVRVLKAKLVTEREILVGVPDDLRIEMCNGEAMIVEPGSGVGAPKVMLSATLALNRGLLVNLEPEHGVPLGQREIAER